MEGTTASVMPNASSASSMPHADEFNPYFAYVGGGIFFFTVVNYLTRYTMPASSAGSFQGSFILFIFTRNKHTCIFMSLSFVKELIHHGFESRVQIKFHPQASWKWRNIATSLVHSTITAVWSPLGFYLHPEMLADVAFAFNRSTHVLVSFSVGYFIYDFLDMYLYNQRNSQKNTYELLIHHVCAIACFGVSSHTRALLPFASLALVVEINSVFLHVRQLFIMAGKPRHATAYRDGSDSIGKI